MNEVKINDDGITVSITWELLAEGIELGTTMLADEEFIAGMTTALEELIEANS